MRTIAIILNDNDFGQTFLPLLESIKSAIDRNAYQGGLTEEVITNAILAGVAYHYVLFQLGNNLNKSGYGGVESTSKYLRDVKVLFDEAAEQDVLHVDRDGGAWYLEIYSGYISSY